MRTEVLVLVALLVAGCSTRPSDGPGASDPSQSAGAADGPGGEPPRGDARARLPVDLVAADTNGVLYRVDAGTGNATPLPSPDPFPPNSELTSIRWSPDGNLYGTIRGRMGQADAIVRFNLATGARTTVASGPPLANPYALTAVAPDRILVADGGESTGATGSRTGAETPRVVVVNPTDGTARLLVADPRFSGTDLANNWMDIAAGPDGNAYLLSGGADHRVVTPPDASDDAGGGAIWRVDPANGLSTLVSASPQFKTPEGLTVLSDGSLAVTEWSDARAVLHVNPSTGEARRVVHIPTAGSLWGIEELPDRRWVVVDVGGDPLNLTDDEGGSGGLYVVDPHSGTYELVVSDPRFVALSHVRVWRT